MLMKAVSPKPQGDLVNGCVTGMLMKAVSPKPQGDLVNGCVTGMLIKAVSPKPQGDLVNGSSELSMSASENGLLLQYKDLIREQDCRLQQLTQTVDRLTAEKFTLQVGHLHLFCSALKFISEFVRCFVVWDVWFDMAKRCRE
jgi:hypothetical protein